MNEYGASLLSLMGPMMFGVSLLLWLVVIGPLLTYPIARWKQNREGVFDAQLGMKTIVHYFRMIGFQTLLLGATILLWTIISKQSEKGESYRMAFGFIVPGAIVFAVHHAVLARTNDMQFPNVHRLFAGYNVIVLGLMGTAALTGGCQALFAKSSTGDGARLFMAAIVVYGGAWGACAVQFSKLVFGSSSSMMPPSNMMPPPGRSATPQQSGGLPPLSHGAYPPIEPKY